ncbi:hypothetical protein ABIA39_005697 [Nocardia sp. GAS34]
MWVWSTSRATRRSRWAERAAVRPRSCAGRQKRCGVPGRAGARVVGIRSVRVNHSCEDHRPGYGDAVSALVSCITPAARSIAPCFRMCRVQARASATSQMLTAAKRFNDRVWAVEGCNGVGRHLAHRLVHDGESVVDVPAKLSAQVRVFAMGNGRPPRRTRLCPHRHGQPAASTAAGVAAWWGEEVPVGDAGPQADRHGQTTRFCRQGPSSAGGRVDRRPGNHRPRLSSIHL